MLILRRIAVLVFALVLLAAVGVGALWGWSSRRIARSWANVGTPVAMNPVPDSITLERGRHLLTAIGKCGDCHGDDLGGGWVINEPIIGRVYAPNLTRGAGGVIARYADADWERSIRHGVAPDGRALVVMPSADFQHFADADVAALVSALRAAPPVDRVPPIARVQGGPVARALYAKGDLVLMGAEKVDHGATHAAAAEPAPTAAYGRYLSMVGGCVGCHAQNLAGGPIPGGPPEWPPAANITPTGLKRYDEAAFFAALREGRRPDGTAIRGPMPVSRTRLMSDDEVRALWAYLQTVPPHP